MLLDALQLHGEDARIAVVQHGRWREGALGADADLRHRRIRQLHADARDLAPADLGRLRSQIYHVEGADAVI